MGVFIVKQPPLLIVNLSDPTQVEIFTADQVFFIYVMFKSIVDFYCLYKRDHSSRLNLFYI